MQRLLRTLILMVVSTGVLATAGSAGAAPTASLTIVVPNAKVPLVEYGSKAKLTARLTSDVATVATAGQPVTLLADPWPFDGIYAPVATATTGETGAVVFQPAPVRNTNYRIDWSANDTATTPAVATTVSSTPQLVYTDLKQVAYTARFARNGHFLISGTWRGDATLDLSKELAYAYVRMNHKGAWVRRGAVKPKTSGSTRVWKFDIVIPHLKPTDVAQEIVCSKDLPNVFGIGRPGLFPLCGRASFTQAQLARY